MRTFQLDKTQNSENWLSRGVIEFDPEIYEKYFKGYDFDAYVISFILILLFAVVLGVVTFVKLRRKREEKRLEAFMTMETLDEERDGVPPPPDGLTIGREPGVEANEVSDILATDQKTWLSKLHSGLSKTRKQLSESLSVLFKGKTKLSDEVLEKIHESLYKADVGVQTSDLLLDKVRSHFAKDAEVEWNDVKSCLIDEIEKILAAPSKSVQVPKDGPFVLLVVGVNGVGKTTSCGKLAAHFLADNKTVMLAAADTFRAAAIDQLKVWGDRLDVEVVAHKQGADPAAVAFDAVKSAKAKKIDVLLIDTAGRLHNKKELMDELQKIYRVIGKEISGAPHESWLVIDATTGQNAAMQVKAFSEVVNITGLVVTKLDGTAKGGVLVGISDIHKLPIRYIGVGEKSEDLRVFSSEDYSKSLF